MNVDRPGSPRLATLGKRCRALAAGLAPLLLGGFQGRALASSPEVQEVAAPLQAHQLARKPWLAWEQRWPGAPTLKFGSIGSDAAMTWRNELENAENRLLQIDRASLNAVGRADFDALEAWVVAQTILLDSRPLESSNPRLYVAHADETVRTLARVGWITGERRRALTQELFDALPDFWAEARNSLISPSREWIDEALQDLTDLDRRLDRQRQGRAPEAEEERTPAREKAIAATTEFRRWLTEMQRTSAHPTPRMSESAWIDLVQAVSGSSLTTSELKAQLLRDLADFEGIGAPSDPRGEAAFSIPSVIDQVIASSAEMASAVKGLRFVRRLHMPPKLDVEFYTGLFMARRPFRLAPEVESWRLYLELPSSLWPAEMQATRKAMFLGSGPRALGVRLGLGGEALLRSQFSLPGKRPAAYLWNRAVFEGFGLWALDWAPRAEGSAGGDSYLSVEAGWALKLEAARLLASLELHAEGVSVTEAADSFQRRTAVDPWSALAEVRLAQHDPLSGIGYLGFGELRAFESELAQVFSEQLALSGSLFLVLSSPNLRPVDQREMIASLLSRRLGGKRAMVLPKNLLRR